MQNAVGPVAQVMNVVAPSKGAVPSDTSDTAVDETFGDIFVTSGDQVKQASASPGDHAALGRPKNQVMVEQPGVDQLLTDSPDVTHPDPGLVAQTEIAQQAEIPVVAKPTETELAEPIERPADIMKVLGTHSSSPETADANVKEMVPPDVQKSVLPEGRHSVGQPDAGKITAGNTSVVVTDAQKLGLGPSAQATGAKRDGAAPDIQPSATLEKSAPASTSPAIDVKKVAAEPVEPNSFKPDGNLEPDLDTPRRERRPGPDAPKAVTGISSVTAQAGAERTQPPPSGVSTDSHVNLTVGDEKATPLNSGTESKSTIFAVETTRGTTTAAAVAAPPASTTPLQAQSAAYQISQAVQKSSSREVEIRLDPEELGKVRLVLSAREGQMLVTVLAERPETLELLRRNSDQLSSNFSDIGYDTTEFDFQDQGDGHQPLPDDNGFEAIDYVEQDLNIELTRDPGGGLGLSRLDIRI